MSQLSTFITLHWSYPLSHQLSEGYTTIGNTHHSQKWLLGHHTHGIRVYVFQVMGIPVAVLGHHVANLLLYFPIELWRSGIHSPPNCSLSSLVLVFGPQVHLHIHQMVVALPASLRPHL